MKHHDIFSLIKADHRTVEELFAKIEKTTEHAVRTRERLYAKLREELNKHTEAEETAVYPRLKREGLTDKIAFEAVEEHEVVKYLLTKLDALLCDRRDWTALITVLKETVAHHVKEEEHELFPLMRKAFSREELAEMATEFEKSKMGIMERLVGFLAAENSERAA
jgi:hemerythrin superfamily protein